MTSISVVDDRTMLLLETQAREIVMNMGSRKGQILHHDDNALIQAESSPKFEVDVPLVAAPLSTSS
jgi:hypothetical protein